MRWTPYGKAEEICQRHGLIFSVFYAPEKGAWAAQFARPVRDPSGAHVGNENVALVAGKNPMVATARAVEQAYLGLPKKREER